MMMDPHRHSSNSRHPHSRGDIQSKPEQHHGHRRNDAGPRIIINATPAAAYKEKKNKTERTNKQANKRTANPAHRR
jgi:hypothetical protein